MKAIERDDAAAAAKRRAKMVSLVMDMHLYLLGGEVRGAVDNLRNEHLLQNPKEAVQAAAKVYETWDISGIEGFAAHFEDFGVEDGAALHQVIASHSAIVRSFVRLREGLVTDFPVDDVLNTLVAHRGAMAQYLIFIRRAREITMKHSGLTAGQIAATDF